MSFWKKTTTIEEGLKNWTDEECLTELSKFFTRVSINTQFLQNDEGLLTHQILTTACGDKYMASSPQELEWPLQPVPLSEEQKAMLN